MGDPFRVDVPSHVLSAGRSDLRLLRGDAFSVVIAMTCYPQVVPTYGYWEATLSASLLQWPVIRRSYRPTATERRRFQRRYYHDRLSAGRSDLRLLRGDAFSVVITMTCYPQVVPTYGYWEVTLPASFNRTKKLKLIKFVDQITVNSLRAKRPKVERRKFVSRRNDFF